MLVGCCWEALIGWRTEGLKMKSGSNIRTERADWPQHSLTGNYHREQSGCHFSLRQVRKCKLQAFQSEK